MGWSGSPGYRHHGSFTGRSSRVWVTKTEHELAPHIIQLPGQVGPEAGERRTPEVNSHVPGGDDDSRAVAWSIRRAIELLDEAIDRVGSQLARASTASMDWSVEPRGSQLRRPALRRGSAPRSVRALWCSTRVSIRPHPSEDRSCPDLSRTP